MADVSLEQLLKDRHTAFEKALHYLTCSMDDKYKAASRMIDRIDAVIYVIYKEHPLIKIDGPDLSKVPTPIIKMPAANPTAGKVKKNGKK